MRHQLFRDCHLLARARIAAEARWPAVDREAAEAADLDAVAASERVRHRVEDRLHRGLGVALGELIESFGQPGDEIGAGHAVQGAAKDSKKAPHWRFGRGGGEFEPPRRSSHLHRRPAWPCKATTAAPARPERIERGVGPSKSARSTWKPSRQPSREDGWHDPPARAPATAYRPSSNTPATAKDGP